MELLTPQSNQVESMVKIMYSVLNYSDEEIKQIEAKRYVAKTQ